MFEFLSYPTMWMIAQFVFVWVVASIIILCIPAFSLKQKLTFVAVTGAMTGGVAWIGPQMLPASSQTMLKVHALAEGTSLQQDADELVQKERPTQAALMKLDLAVHRELANLKSAPRRWGNDYLVSRIEELRRVPRAGQLSENDPQLMCIEVFARAVQIADKTGIEYPGERAVLAWNKAKRQSVRDMAAFFAPVALIERQCSGLVAKKS